MTTTSKNTAENNPIGGHGVDDEWIDQIKRRARARKIQAARKLADRLRVAPDGTRTFLRFDRFQRLEHQVLIVTFTILAFTGLLQRYSSLVLVAFCINSFLGGIESLRSIHHLAAFVFVLEAVYHIGIILNKWFIQRETGAMWPRLKDFRDLFGAMSFNARLAKTRPQADRYSAEEKIEYWALLWGTAVMGVTGIIQWFPVLSTRLVPGAVIPFARTVHSWEAVLAVLSIVTWHMYHTVIKERNRSIFNGEMSEEEMLEAHPLEYDRILAARDFLDRIGSAEATHPVQQETIGDHHAQAHDLAQAEATD